MAMSTKKLWSAMIAILAVVLIEGLSLPAFTQQPQEDIVRKLVLERAAQQQPPPASPTPAPAAPGAPVSAPPVPAASPAPTPVLQPAIQRDSGKLMLQFENADLYDFINQIATTLSITPLMIDPDVKGNVTFLSSSPMSKDDVFPVFNTILKNNGAAIIKQGGIYQIVPISMAVKRGLDLIEHLPPAAPENEKTPAAKPEDSGAKKDISQVEPVAKPNPLQTASKAALSSPSAKTEPEDPKAPRLATNVIRPEFVPVKDLIEPIKLLITDGGVIVTYDRLNMLILTDYSDNVERILQIVHMLDNKYLDNDLMDVVRVKNNSASDVLDDLKKIFGTGGKDAVTGISFIPLERLNAIFVMASSKRGLSEVRKWIAQLDSESSRNIQTFVYVVENSTASNIATMLAALYGGEGSSTPAQGGNTQTGGGVGGVRNQPGGMGQTGSFGTGGSGMTQTGMNSGMGTSGGYGGGFGGGFQSGTMGGGGFGGGYMGGSAFGGGQQLGPRLNVNPTISSQVLRGGAFTGLQDTVRLVVDDINNSLIIQATPADYAYLSETIKKMDVLPRQAIIDARIFEVDLNDALSFGVNAALQGRTDGSKGEHLTGAAIDATTGALSANTFAFVGDSRQILMNLNALRNKTKVRVLEAPSVLALDGQMARILVGSEIAYPSSSFTTTVGTTNSVQYRDTGISLIVMPRISASGSVTLDVSQEISGQGTGNSFGPAFTVTSVETTLSVKDGETVAIAGLIRDHNSLGRTGVPLLSQIPLLGNLFGQTTRNADRTELIILITPHVIRTPEKMQERTQELRDSLRNVRKLADEKEQEHREDMENARKERYQQEQKNK